MKFCNRISVQCALKNILAQIFSEACTIARGCDYTRHSPEMACERIITIARHNLNIARGKTVASISRIDIYFSTV